MGQKKIELLLEKMWLDYVAINPIALKVSQLLSDLGEKVSNDHIALRTFRHKRIGIEALAKSFVECGYVDSGEYHFKEKKLYAKHFEHKDMKLPKIFISELMPEEFTPGFQKIIKSLIDQIPTGEELKFDFCSMGRPWSVTKTIYQSLNQESDYAAWVSAFGFRPNHFTVFANELNHFKTLESLNTFLKDKGIKLNSSGGEIKGGIHEFLEQSSTLANTIEVVFDDGAMMIPACYYEFAKRYPTKNGKLYQGFVAQSADKIFESTKRGQ